MSAPLTLDLHEIDEYSKQMLDYVDSEFPEVGKRFMKKEANRLKSKVKKTAAGSIISDTGNYVNGFRAGKKVYEYGDCKFNVRVYNGAPHAHLIEYGHLMKTHSGKVKGFIPGFHILENSSISFQSEFAGHIENDLCEMIKEALEK